jgi:hypothetical protein
VVAVAVGVAVVVGVAKQIIHENANTQLPRLCGL